jgi:hypothetical protein
MLRLQPESPPQHDINVVRKSHCRLVDARYPSGDGIAVGHGIRNIGILEDCCCSQQSLAHFFHGSYRPFQENSPRLIMACGAR